MVAPRAEIRIEDEYFNWLCAKVLTINVPIYFDLMRILHTTEFVWIVPGDRNRAADGVELRDHYLNTAFRKKEPLWYEQPCSVLEALIAFSQRASFQTEITEYDWFWKFLTNLNLNEYRQVYESDKRVIDDILSTFIWRTYAPDGQGGLFPMRWPKQDQRKVEIWYQFCEYLEDQGLI